ncbi:hypothetical protein INT44_004022 [Umbelopsis vinacea]|uniref:DUF3020 domain-containing protein n=1 Tax=Umbelopsis vinacea TaxID=44442 RepID=A0A8H7QA79_9FUNG|nr:hypothetical protein INT44_004022 [Umbelopsis vinacea]
MFACSQCPKVFATRSNLHLENPNIHNIPYVRSRDQKRWKGHAKKVVSKQETTERMRKWRAENRDKNKRNDLRCRVYRLARQRFGEGDCLAKQAFIRDEIAKRLGRRMIFLNEQAPPESPVPSLMPRRSSSTSESSFSSEDSFSDDYKHPYEPHSAFSPTGCLQKPSMVALPPISHCLMQPVDKFSMGLSLPKPTFSACPTPLLSPKSISNGQLPSFNDKERSTNWKLGCSPMSPSPHPYSSRPIRGPVSEVGRNQDKSPITINKVDDKFNILEDFVSTVLDYAGVGDKSL